MKRKPADFDRLADIVEDLHIVLEGATFDANELLEELMDEEKNISRHDKEMFLKKIRLQVENALSDLDDADNEI